MQNSSPHDAYTEKAADYAVPILVKIRKVMHKACPDVQETMKWGAPHFEHQGILAGVAVLKKQVRFVFWKGKQLSDPKGLLEVIGNTDMAAMRIEKLSELPSERVLMQYIKEALRLNKAAASAPQKRAKRLKANRSISAPTDLMAALKRNKKALGMFESFSYSNRKDYVEWIEDAKRGATREKRIQQAVEWMGERKPRNWKYMKQWR